MIIRSDQMLVTVKADGMQFDAHPWDSAYGGEAQDEPGSPFSDLILRRLRSDNSTTPLAWYMSNITHGVSVQIEHLGANGSPTGHGLVYDGVIAKVVPAVYDANSSKLAFDRLIVRPYTLKAI